MSIRRPLRVAVTYDNRWAVIDARKRSTGIIVLRKALADETARALNGYPATERLARASGRIVAFLAFLESAIQLDGEVLADDTVVMSYVGHGASDAIRVEHLRELRAALVAYANATTLDTDTKLQP